MRVSGESNQPVWPRGDLRVKVNLLTFKDEMTKDTVIHHSWQLDVTIFCCLEWDHQHLLPYVIQSFQGLPGDFARSLQKDTTLNDILQTLDEHYGMVMMCDALSKELYSLKKGLGGNVAEFGVCLLQQIQILQSEYLGKIQQEHVEEMKWDCFYEGLNPEYQWKLAHEVDSKHSTRYSDLLLELERWVEARNPPTPENHPNWGIECNSFSDIREPFSFPEVEGQSYLYCPISYGGK